MSDKMYTWVHDGDKVTFDGGPRRNPPKLRLWRSSDWEVIVRIHDDGREEVLYEHHCADSEHWQSVIEKVFGVVVEDVDMNHRSIAGWNRYNDIDPARRKAFNENPASSYEAWTPPLVEYTHCHRCMNGENVRLGLPEILRHKHQFYDEPLDPHDHSELGYGNLFKEKGE